MSAEVLVFSAVVFVAMYGLVHWLGGRMTPGGG